MTFLKVGEQNTEVHPGKRRNKLMKKKYILTGILLLFVFILGFLFSQYLFYRHILSRTTTYYELKQDLQLIDRSVAGTLKKGTQLRINNNFSEGFVQCVLYINFYPEPDTSLYLRKIRYNETNLTIPYWTSKDVSLKK